MCLTTRVRWPECTPLNQLLQIGCSRSSRRPPMWSENISDQGSRGVTIEWIKIDPIRAAQTLLLADDWDPAKRARDALDQGSVRYLRILAWSRTSGSLAIGNLHSSCNGHRPAGSVEPLLSPGGRGAGNGVAARSQLYERSNANRRSCPFIGRSFGKKTRGVGPDSKKTRRFRKFRKLRLLSVVGLTGS